MWSLNLPKLTVCYTHHFQMHPCVYLTLKSMCRSYCYNALSLLTSIDIDYLATILPACGPNAHVVAVPMLCDKYLYTSSLSTTFYQWTQETRNVESERE